MDSRPAQTESGHDKSRGQAAAKSRSELRAEWLRGIRFSTSRGAQRTCPLRSHHFDRRRPTADGMNMITVAALLEALR